MTAACQNSAAPVCMVARTAFRLKMSLSVNLSSVVEVTSLEQTRRRIPRILEDQGYDYFWRPTSGDDTPPFYAWFIKRDQLGNRTHHIHMVEAHFDHWNRLLFRDYLIEHPDVAREYARLKMALSNTHENDRVAYTEAKTDFIRQVTETAKAYYDKHR